MAICRPCRSRPAPTATSSGAYTLQYGAPVDDLPASIAGSGSLAIGGSASGSIDFANDKDWFRIELDAGAAYDLRAVSVSGVTAPSLSLYAADASTSFHVPSNAPYISSKSGTYYLQAFSVKPGNYTVSATLVPDDHGSTTGSATILPLDTEIKGAIERYYDQDWFRMRVADGGYYTLTQRPGANEWFGSNPPVPFFDGGGASFRLVSTSNANGAWTYTIRAIGDGELMVKAGFDKLLGYTFLAKQVGQDDHGDSIATATPLALDTTANGRIELAGDPDFFRVTLDAGVTYAIAGGGALIPADSLPRLSIYLGDSGNVGYGTHLFTPQASGEYAFRATALSYTGAYTITASKVVDDFAANAGGAGQMAIGGEAQGVVSSSADRDWFAVMLTEGQTYWFDATADRLVNEHHAPTFKLLGSDGVLIEKALWDDSAFSTIAFRAPASGVYYLEAGGADSNQDQSGTARKYAISARIGTADDHTQPHPVAIGTRIEGSIEVPHDTDVFRFELVAGTFYSSTFVLANARSETSKFYDAASLTFDYMGSSDSPVVDLKASTAVPFQALTSGIYEVRISNFGRDFDSYQLQLNALASDDHYPGQPARALAPGTQRTGRIDVAGDVDSFNLPLAAGQTADITITGDRQNSISTNNSGVAGIGQGGVRHWIINALYARDFAIAASGADPGDYTVSVRDTSADDTAPAMLGVQPAGPIAHGNLSIAFSEAMIVSNSARDGWLYEAAGGLIDTISLRSHVTFNDGLVAFETLGAFAPGASYRIEIPANSFFDLSGNGLPAIDYTFKAGNAPAVGTDGADVFGGMLNGSTFKGGAGIDAVVYAGRPAAFGVQNMSGGGEMRIGFRRYDGALNFDNTNSDVLSGIERIYFVNYDTALALDVGLNGIAGTAYRMYQAAFSRRPDQDGLGFWINALDTGISLDSVARAFISSAEFVSAYGVDATSKSIVTRLYQNVLYRDGDQAGIDFWVAAIDKGVPLADVLLGFCNSDENVNQLAMLIGQGFLYTPYGG